jgi:hypothetical protein
VLLPSYCFLRLWTCDKSRAHVCAAVVDFMTVPHHHMVASPVWRAAHRIDEVDNRFFLSSLVRKVH